MKDYSIKVGNMAKAQEFTLYPYKGGDTIDLQSDKRWITANLHTGEGRINNKNVNHPTSYHLFNNPIAIKLPEDILKQIQAFLWHNDGQQGELKQGGVTLLTWDISKFPAK
jgi:hypothetical protein